MDHYKSPRNFKRLKKPDASSYLENPLCGDKIGIDIKLTTYNSPARNASQSDAGGQLTTINNISFFGEGCAISIASASMLTEKVIGLDIESVKRMTSKDVIKILGINLTPTRLKCALLPLEVIHKTLTLVK